MTGTSTPNRASDRGPDPAGRRVGVARQERHERARPGPDVRGVDAAVGADEPVRRLGDQHAVRHADDAAGLAQDDLDLAGVAVELGRELDGLRARVDAGEVDDGALGLRDDLLGDDEHVVLAERQQRPVSVRGRRR